MNANEITKEQFHALSIEAADELYMEAMADTSIDSAVIMRLQEWEIDPDNPRLTDADKEFLSEWKAEQAFLKLQAEASEYATEFFAEYIQPLLAEGMSLREALLVIIESYKQKGLN